MGWQRQGEHIRHPLLKVTEKKIILNRGITGWWAWEASLADWAAPLLKDCPQL